MRKNKMILSVALIAMLAVFAEVFAATAVVNLSDEKQVIRGFGGMNHPIWIGDLTAAQRNVAFGNADNQLGFTVLRIWVSDNSNDWSREVATAKDAYDRGHLVFASPWNPPSSMRETFYRDANNPEARRLKASSYAAYATHLNDFVTYMKNNGVNLHAISVQNEPDYAEEWTWWTSDEMIAFLKNNASAINCKIIAPEEFQYSKRIIGPILNDPAALAKVDIIGTHTYGTQYSAFPYPLFKEKGAGKELWMTEVYHPNSNSSADTWPEALDVARHVHSAMADAEFQMYVWWYIRRSYSPMKEDGTISKRGYMMAHFSKFVRPGYRRVEVTKTPNTNVYVSSYKGDNKVVIVAVNMGTSAVNQDFTINNGTVSSVELWRTSSNQNMAKQSNINLNNGSFTTSLPAQSVTTFVGSLPAANVNITCNVSNLEASYVAGNSIPRPNVGCSNGTAAGAASFSSSGSEITGWATPGGTHGLYNEGQRTITLNSLECDGVNVTPPTPITCGTIQIVPDATPIANSLPVVNSKTPAYYTIKGEPVGSVKPAVPGVYLVKQGSSVRKIVVK